ncbi:MAG: hypothetical protein LM517_02600 [Nitrosomonas sp.]|nr:hypothetical protein [Nitrosomonas sp.]
MNIADTYFKQAELALAAYAKNLVAGRPDIEKLRDAEFSDSQALNFANTYRVVTQLPDTTGLSATIFADNLTGETFLAIRGTEITDPNDLFAGLSLAMFGSTVLQPQYASLRSQVQAW